MRVYKKIPTILQCFFWWPTRRVLEIFFGFETSGEERLNLVDNKRGVILVANHICMSDPILIRASMPFHSSLAPLFYVALKKKDYSHYPVGRYLFGGALFRSFGAYPVLRGIYDFEKALAHHIRILEDGGTVCIFPQGGIGRDGARPGVAYLAKRTGAMVVPVLVQKGEGRLRVAWGNPFVPSISDDFKKEALQIMEKVYEV